MLIELLDKEMFMTQYQRNNKAKAKKNLRCFPACRHEGHVPAGFCGRAIRVKVTYSPDELHLVLNEPRSKGSALSELLVQ